MILKDTIQIHITNLILKLLHLKIILGLLFCSISEKNFFCY